MVDVVGFGALNFDRLFKVEEIAERGTEVNVIDEIGAPGGSAANTIYGLAKLGIETGFIGAIGDDLEGEEIIAEFVEIGVDASRVMLFDEVRTGIVIGFVDDVGERALYVSPGANNEISVSNIDMEFLESSKIVHMSSFVGDKQFVIQKEICKSLGDKVIISLCPGALYARRGMEQLRSMLEVSDIVFLNEAEIEGLTGKSHIGGAMELLELGCKIVVVTLREEGCFIMDKDGAHEVPTQAAKAVDTTGAGDSFATGFLYGFLKNLTPHQCGMIGNRVSAKCIQAVGARACLPTEDELQSADDFPK
ncbi:MAG: carbohydrate kinase family protein [Methanobacteriota archaeon]|nr:MAG: carbohydrate kinase family protein [Euryarchaeota archaeon]